MKSYYWSLLLSALLLVGCGQKDNDSSDADMILEEGCYPQATFWHGKYYFTMEPEETSNSISIYATDNLLQLAQAEQLTVWHVDSMKHIWSPELHRIHNKWYLYFEADDGNTDNHQLYVLENPSDNPMSGKFQLKGAIKTNEEWNFGLHPTSIIVRGQQYLLWSGWEHRRLETETQCIYIARMKDPWTLDSERVMLSKPEMEWERQWINPDGDRSAYPIFVNENPEAFITPDSRYVCVCYSASGIWTVYRALGMLYARTDADLLNPLSWTKVREPLFKSEHPERLYGTSNISLVQSPDGKQQLLLYEAYHQANDSTWQRSIFMKPMVWGNDRLPLFGHP